MAWRSSSFGSGVQIRRPCLASGGMWQMRRSSDPGTVLSFTEAEWEAFRLGAAEGEFDLDELAQGAVLAEGRLGEADGG